jgi:radical SAM protein with 4Fe4S-binding SPASM domain
LSLLCNISPQATDSAKLKDLRTNTLQKLGPKVRLGITLTSPEFEYCSLIETIKRFDLCKSIRVGIAQPIVGAKNDFLDPQEYKKTGTAITAMVVECEKEDILIGFDCGMTMCMFTEEELGLITRRSIGFTSLCSPIIDIGTNLDIWYCFPLSEILNTRIEKYRTRGEMERVFQEATKAYRSLGCKPECLSCKYLKRGQCSGGCLAHTLNSLEKLPPQEIT